MKNTGKRRDFLKAMGIAAGAIMVGGVVHGLRKLDQAGYFNLGKGPVPDVAMPKRVLGRTGIPISIFALGGEAHLEYKQRLPFGGPVAIINRALDRGVNYIDTSAIYGYGQSEKNIGKVLKTRRAEVFLATKTHDRTYDGTMRLAERSLENLQTDYLDLYQVHDVQTHEQLDRIHAPGGAIKAMERLRDEKLVRHIGITGHYDVEVLLRGIREYEFDTILLSLNAADVHQNPFQEELLETAVAKGMGIIAMKVLAKGRLLRPDGISSMEQALGYVLSFPVTSAAVGISSMRELEENVRIASSLELPFSPERLAELENLARASAKEANWFKRQA